MSKKILNEVFSDFSLFWQKKITVPWRPSLRECLFVDNIIKSRWRGKKLRALVLGSTPEWRDVLFMNKAEVLLLDAKPKMFKAMSNACYYGSSKEKYVQGDWLSFPAALKSRTFDLVISDRPLENVSFSDWPKLLREVNRVLKPEGIFLLGIANNNFSRTALTVKKMLELFRRGPQKFAHVFERISFLYDIVRDCGSFDKKTFTHYFALTREIFKRKAKKFGATDRELKQMWFLPEDINGRLFRGVLEVLPPLSVAQQVIKKAGFKVNQIMRDPSIDCMKIKRMLFLTKK